MRPDVAGDRRDLKLTRVLLVDDQRDVRYVMAEILEDLGHCVVTAASGPECLDLLSSEPPEVILLDLHMPGLSGLETLIGMGGCGIPVVVMTGSRCERTLAQARTLGAVGLIPKPWTLTQVENSLNRATAQRAA
jgi:CheY-like chemotaxis protein